MAAGIVELGEKLLKKLKPEQFVRVLMGFPARRRLDLIVERPDAQSVVKALDANDFFHTVVEIGADDALPLLAMANVEQLSFLFDIEWWRKEDLQPAKALTWLERLWGSGGPGLLEWLSNADFELLVSLFKQWIVVDIIPEDTDLVEAAEKLPSNTLDDLYFWDSRYPQFDDLMTHLLTVVFETNYGFFKELMNSILYASTLEMEESACHFHRARLADHAIPDFYDALEIYKSIGPEEFTEKTAAEIMDEDQPVPSFALAVMPKGDLLARVLNSIENPLILETIQIEMAALANKVIVADQLPSDNSEALRRAVEKTLAYVNLGLELQSGGNGERAREIIRRKFMEHLFRFAQARAAGIRGRLQAIVQKGWLKQCPTGMKILDGQWLDDAEELLAKTPRVPGNMPGEDPPGENPVYGFFRTPEDINRADRIVDIIEAAGDLYRLLSDNTIKDGRKLWLDGLVRAPEDITLGIMVLTSAANFLTERNWAAKPFSHKAWPEIFPFVKPHDMEMAVLDWVHRSLPAGEERFLAEAYLRPVLRDYDFEMSPFSDRTPPEARLVRFFLFGE